MSTLYVVATPIGNLGDLTTRASDVLSRVPVVAAEDTRVTKKLLNHLGVNPKLESLHEHSSPERIEAVCALLESGDMAVVSDAGTPGVSDPGSKLVAAAVEAGHNIEPLPGPSAVVTALSITGWEFSRFLFLGFLPRKNRDRAAVLEGVRKEPGPIVVYESPHRVSESLKAIADVFEDRPVVVCRELTKKFEEIFRGTAGEAATHFENSKGEFALVIKGSGVQEDASLSDDELRSQLESASESGLSGRSLVDEIVSKTGESKSRVYRLSLELKS